VILKRLRHESDIAEKHTGLGLRSQEQLSFAPANRYNTSVNYYKKNMGQIQKNELVSKKLYYNNKKNRGSKK
jgi:hypothetical protein